MGMLAYFVNIFTKANQLTPSYVLVLFIVSTLAVAWCILTLLRRKSTRRSAHFVCFVDVCFIGALIAGVYYLRSIANANCSHFSDDGDFSVTLGSNGVSGNNGFDFNINKECAMLKASFAFGIMNTILFAITAFWLLFMKREDKEVVVKETYRRRSHESRYACINTLNKQGIQANNQCLGEVTPEADQVATEARGIVADNITSRIHESFHVFSTASRAGGRSGFLESGYPIPFICVICSSDLLY
ncbi:MAG: hypothetical protein HETSPECPRED_006033 [Heterodermia speciosa]|uniref:MARVEL domain-containing protein n=1 Tax=Heterodermia speciosa TaxID=116794 RepID=A0A8H3IA73_9LECA|nr:MAG: hypothetical protein HETSPECPRED_006033 [Heterodermia speciosa]